MARLKINRVKEIIYNSLRQGDLIKIACNKAGITKQSYDNWMSLGKEPLPENKSDCKPNQEYYREFYLEIQWIKVQNQQKEDDVEPDATESPQERRRRRYIQAQKAFDDYLYGRHVTKWTNRETLTIVKPGEPNEVHEKESVKIVTHPPARWAIQQILPEIDLVSLVQQSVELGILDPQALDSIEALGESQISDVISIYKTHSTKDHAHLN